MLKHEVRKAYPTFAKLSYALLVMKNTLLFLVFLLLISASSSYAQGNAADSLPYIKYPTLPAFKLLMQDSETVFNTYAIPEGKPTLLMFFSPDCDHCQMVTDTLIKHIDELKDVQIYMLTPMSLTAIKGFYEKMGLKKFKNIVVAKDYEIFFPRFYKAYYVPFLVAYDRHKKYVKSFEGGGKFKDIREALR